MLEDLKRWKEQQKCETNSKVFHAYSQERNRSCLPFTAPHLLQRWVERLGHSFQNGKQCAEVIGSYLADERLITVFERVPVYGSVALYIESLKTLFFMDMGTRKDPNEIKVSTVLYRANESQRFLVDAEDYCYILPKEGKLRFGKERKYFELKKRAPKWRPSHQT